MLSLSLCLNVTNSPARDVIVGENLQEKTLGECVKTSLDQIYSRKREMGASTRITRRTRRDGHGVYFEPGVEALLRVRCV